MTDRELLELAAKAGGLPHQWCDAWNTMAKPRPDDGFFFDKVWNPLTNDGDALRLAVKLRLELRFLDMDHTIGPPRVTFYNVAGLVELIGTDPYAATRRAIVRAAAEIGRSKE
jgi:hypothetical protein